MFGKKKQQEQEEQPQPQPEDTSDSDVQISNDTMERSAWNEASKAMMVAAIMTPDFQNPKYVSDKEKKFMDIKNQFSKELKLGFLDSFQQQTCQDACDLADACAQFGFVRTASQLTNHTQYALCLSNSKGGKLLNILNEDISVRRIESPADKVKSFFKRKE